jgi:TonB dependent receptor.
MAEEEYFSGLKDIFNRFNIRASYGVNGNISLDYTPYLILSVGSYNNTTGGVSHGIRSYPNNQLRWEKTNIVDFGLDIAMLNNRFNMSIDYYYKKSTDLIVRDAVDETTGTSYLNQNVGGVTNKGIEITLFGDMVKHNDFAWNSNLIFAYNKSMVDYYNVNRRYFDSFTESNSLLVQGYPMDGLWGAKFAGLNNEGTALFYNSKGEKVEGGSLKAEDAVYLGTNRPKADMSWTNTFRYKNIETSFMFIGKFGHKYRKDCFSGVDYSNRHVGKRWRKPGDEANTIYPVLKSFNMDMFYFPYSDILIGNANYVKLRDFTLSYYLPSTLVNKAKLSNVKVYFQTRNLFYITGKGVDIDPETAEVNSWGSSVASPQLRPEFYFGISINL